MAIATLPFKWTSIYYADGRLTVKSREVSKPRNSGLDFSTRSTALQSNQNYYNTYLAASRLHDIIR